MHEDFKLGHYRLFDATSTLSTTYAVEYEGNAL